jgi:hypothetical protein
MVGTLGSQVSGGRLWLGWVGSAGVVSGAGVPPQVRLVTTTVAKRTLTVTSLASIRRRRIIWSESADWWKLSADRSRLCPRQDSNLRHQL